MQRLAIIGSGDLGMQIAYYAIADKHYEVSGFFDDWEIPGSVKNNFPIFGKTGDILAAFKDGRFDVLMIGIGYRHFPQRKKFFEDFKDKVPFGKLVHSSCYIDQTANIGEGAFIYPRCIIDRNVVLEDNVLVNTGSLISHDSIIGSHSYISPRTAIAGFVKIGSCCNIGINSTVVDHIVVTDHVQTGGGTVIIKNLQSPGLYVGNPARFVR